MKSGILIYSANQGRINIGDYIQSLASLQFFDNKVDFYINRERLDEYNDDSIKLIMNGWFTTEPNHWPPSSKIVPLFVAFHINSSAKDELLSDLGIKYLKEHSPIGCRDLDTTLLLKEKNIDSFFSGCLTLTLNKNYKSDLCSDKIYFVDAFSSTNKNLSSLISLCGLFISKLPYVVKLTKKQFGIISFYNFRKTLSFYREYSKHFTDSLLLEAEYIQHELSDSLFSTEIEKFEFAKELLNKYAQAKLVVTSRIHSALPCLGLETPVIFVDNAQQHESSYCRLNGLRELFNLVDSVNGELNFRFDKGVEKIDKSFALKNKEDYKLLQLKLTEICERFIDK